MASNVWQLEEHQESYGSSKLKVTILASEWGSSKGGLSTINRELAIQLAKFSCVDVTLFLPKCSDEDKKAAASHGISILTAVRRPGYHDELDWLSFPPDHLRIGVVVGHGVKLGHQAQVIRDSHKCKWVQIVHTDPEGLGMFKCYENPISTGEQKHHEEVELCQMADFVVGVGPKLTEAFHGYLSWSKKDVFEFTPGVFADFSSVQLVAVKRKQCRVLVFGHGDSEDFELKGFDIAARSVATLSDTCLYFVGVPHGKHEELAKHFVDLGVPANRLRVRGYVDSREDLKKLFCEVDLVLMPSRTEGFGLTGLEALSAGLPVIVSKNSGFGEALGSVRFGSFFVIDSEDPSAWTAAIKGIWNKDRKSQLDEIKAVQDSYGKKYSWSKQCKGLVGKMFKLVDGTSSEPETTARGVEAKKRKRNKNSTGHFSRVPPKRKKGIQKKESAQLAGTSSQPENTAQELKARKRKRNKNFRGHSPRIPPKRKRGMIEKNELEQPAELFVKLLISTSNLEKEKEEAMEKILTQTVQSYLKFHDHSRDDRTEAMQSLINHLINTYRVNLVTVGKGSIIIIVECPTLESLKHLWSDYLAGHLDKVAERYLLTDEMKKELNLETISVKITMKRENYLKCKKALEERLKRCFETSVASDQPPPAEENLGKQEPSAIVETEDQHSLKEYGGCSPRVPPKMKRGIIGKNEREQPAGHSSPVPPKRKKGIKRNETAQPADESVSKDDVLLIAHELGPLWKNVGRVLKVPKAVIDHIDANESEVSEKCHSVLTRWQQRYPSDATYHRLALALQHPTVDRVDVAVKYCGLQLKKVAEEEEEEEEEDAEEEEEDQQPERGKPTKKKGKKTEKVSKFLKDLVDDASDSLDKICEDLDTPTAGLGNYENVAKHYGYKVSTVRSRFKTSPDGPSKALILAIIAEHPDVTVESFASVVVKQARREDVARLLREFDRK